MNYGFESWWRDIGSGITPDTGADMEEHARKVAFEAWKAMRDRAADIASVEADLDVAQSIEMLL